MLACGGDDPAPSPNGGRAGSSAAGGSGGGSGGDTAGNNDAGDDQAGNSAGSNGGDMAGNTAGDEAGNNEAGEAAGMGGEAGAQAGGDAGADAEAGAGGEAGDNMAGVAGEPEPEPAPNTALFVYASGNAQYNNDEMKITAFSLDGDTGAASQIDDINAGPQPNYAAFHPSGKYMYVGNENQRRIRAFEIAKDGKLTAAGDIDPGDRPVHIWMHPSGKFILGSSYGGGTVFAVSLNEDGSLNEATDKQDACEQAHQVITDPAGKFAFAPCRAGNRVAQFAFDVESGKFTRNDPGRVNLNGGPRHMAFHPSEKWAYVLTQDSGEIVQYNYDAASGILGGGNGNSVSKTNMNNDEAAHIQLTPNGEFLYVSGRQQGQRKIRGYKVDPDSGELDEIDAAEKNIDGKPWDFTIGPNGKFLAVATEFSSEMVVFEIGEDGGLNQTAKVDTESRSKTVIIVPVPQD